MSQHQNLAKLLLATQKRKRTPERKIEREIKVQKENETLCRTKQIRWRINKMDNIENKIKNMFGGPYHQSDLSHYARCPWSFKLDKFTNLTSESRNCKTVFGSIVHNIFAAFHEGIFDNTCVEEECAQLFDSFLKKFETFDPPIQYSMGREKFVADYKQKLVDIVLSYTQDPFNQDIQEVLCEVPFQVKVGKHDFEGTIDQIRLKKDGTVQLIDLKTGVDRPGSAFLRIGYQFSLYSYAMEHGFFGANARDWIRKPDEIVYYKLSDCYPFFNISYRGEAGIDASEDYIEWLKTKEKTAGGKYKLPQHTLRGPIQYYTSRSENQLQDFVVDAKRIVRSIKFRIFYRNPDIFNNPCLLCSFRTACLSGEASSKALVSDIDKLDLGE